MTDQVKYDGVNVTIDGRDYTVPPLCLRDIKRLLPKMATIEDATPIEAMDTLCEIVHMAMLRNYPELTREELEVMLDTSNINEISEKVMQASGLKKKAASPVTESP